MPVTPTYPGVYIEEVPSGVRTITGVATSIAAFIGRALRGPVDEPVTINGFADFERTFGGLWAESTLGYAVQDFFLNGGGQAVIVRLYRGEGGADPAPGTAQFDVGDLTLQAASPGAWGNALTAVVDHLPAGDVADAVAARYGLATADFFNLTVVDTVTGAVEEHRNLTVVDSPRRVDLVLASESRLVRVLGALPAAVPADAAEGEVADADAASNGQGLDVNSFTGAGMQAAKTGLYALEKTDLFNLLCIPPYLATDDVDTALVDAAAAYCATRRALMIVDPPADWLDVADAVAGVGDFTKSKNAALYFPRIRKPNPLRENRLETFVPCGAVAGVFARTDAQRGVWKAPAGTEATLVGVTELSVSLTDGENGQLNPLGVNCLRAFPAAGRVVWGARTLQGDDRLASEWKYVPVRRTALFLEESLYRGTQWVVFEPNDEPLWAQIRLNVGAFMHSLFRQGAFQGKTPREAYFVKCDKDTTTQDDINRGIVNVHVGFAPLKPAEFVIIKIQQMAGQIQS